MPWIHHTLVTAPFTDLTWQHIRRTVTRLGSRVQHEHDLALALRKLLERAAAGQGSHRERVVTARARAGAGATNHGGAMWGILYGQQPEVRELEPACEDVFDDSEDDEEPLTDDAAVSAWPTEGAQPSDSSTAPAQETGVPVPRRARVTVYDPFEESLRW